MSLPALQGIDSYHFKYAHTFHCISAGLTETLGYVVSASSAMMNSTLKSFLLLAAPPGGAEVQSRRRQSHGRTAGRFSAAEDKGGGWPHPRGTARASGGPGSGGQTGTDGGAPTPATARGAGGSGHRLPRSGPAQLLLLLLLLLLSDGPRSPTDPLQVAARSTGGELRHAAPAAVHRMRPLGQNVPDPPTAPQIMEWGDRKGLRSPGCA